MHDAVLFSFDYLMFVLILMAFPLSSFFKRLKHECNKMLAWEENQGLVLSFSKLNSALSIVDAKLFMCLAESTE